MKPSILVIGDLILDHYIWGQCERISPEAPVQVIEVAKETLNLGGACNVANNLVALECEVFICGMVGKDEAGTKLKETLESLHIHTQGIYYNLNRPTTQKSRIIAAHQKVIRVDREDKSPISQEGEECILNFAKTLIESHKIDCIILSDYQKGVLSENLTQNLIKIAKDSKLKILIDPKGKDYSKYKGATLLTPNKKEAKEATGIQIVDDSTLLLALQNLKKSCNLEYSLITLSEDGIGILDDKLHKLPTIAKKFLMEPVLETQVLLHLLLCLPKMKIFALAYHLQIPLLLWWLGQLALQLQPNKKFLLIYKTIIFLIRFL